MDTSAAIESASSTSPFGIVFIGAGAISFGSNEGPWNHSLRLEKKLGARLRVIALIDPSIQRTNFVLKNKRESVAFDAYADTKAVKSLEEFLEYMKSPEYKPENVVRAFVIGSPPAYRGSDVPGRDIELKLLQHFPGVPLFVEKPVATGPASTALQVAKKVQAATPICSVGYMLRYLKAVQMMKQILEENNLTVMATMARYACAYEPIAKTDWWDKSRDCGPIVEQGTHFCDLSRYFGGEVDLSTIQANSLEFYEKAGHLSKIALDESKIPPKNRIPRVTSATWKYESGAVGALTHVVCLHGVNYSCELEVYADGYQLRLIDPYVKPALYVRRPGNDLDEVYNFHDDDPFLGEFSAFVDSIDQGSGQSKILSTYEDACKTYEFSWAIREASERTRKNPPE
jgi:predicted dehydrogenase